MADQSFSFSSLQSIAANALLAQNNLETVYKNALMNLRVNDTDSAYTAAFKIALKGELKSTQTNKSDNGLKCRTEKMDQLCTDETYSSNNAEDYKNLQEDALLEDPLLLLTKESRCALGHLSASSNTSAMPGSQSAALREIKAGNWALPSDKTLLLNAPEIIKASVAAVSAVAASSTTLSNTTEVTRQDYHPLYHILPPLSAPTKDKKLKFLKKRYRLLKKDPKNTYLKAVGRENEDFS